MKTPDPVNFKKKLQELHDTNMEIARCQSALCQLDDDSLQLQITINDFSNESITEDITFNAAAPKFARDLRKSLRAYYAQELQQLQQSIRDQLLALAKEQQELAA